MTKRIVGFILILYSLYALAIIFASYAPAYSQEIAVGDSLAVGLELPGDAKIGRSPAAVVTALSGIPLRLLHQRVVILSTGLSNDPSQMDEAKLQLDMLEATGSKVILLGVGVVVPGSFEINAWLKAEAEDRGWIFIWGWQGVHPQDYRRLLAAARAEECRYWRICGI